MQFFVPGANDPHQAAESYSHLRAAVEQIFGSIKPTQIFRLAYPNGGKRCTIAVGDSVHLQHGNPILAIFEGTDYYVCTGPHVRVEPETFVVPRDGGVEVETFH